MYDVCISVFSRTIIGAFAICAALCLKFSNQLLDPSFSIDGDTLYVPLLSCYPREIYVNHQTYVIDTSEDITFDCTTQDDLVYLCNTFLLMSIIAIVFWLFVDTLAHCHIGPFRRKLSIGMGSFMIFMLIQSGLTCAAVAGELVMVKLYYDDALEELTNNPKNRALQGLTAKAHAGIGLLIATAVLSLVSGIITIFEGFVHMMVGDQYEMDRKAERERLENLAKEKREKDKQKEKEEKQAAKEAARKNKGWFFGASVADEVAATASTGTSTLGEAAKSGEAAKTGEAAKSGEVTTTKSAEGTKSKAAAAAVATPTKATKGLKPPPGRSRSPKRNVTGAGRGRPRSTTPPRPKKKIPPHSPPRSKSPPRPRSPVGILPIRKKTYQ